MWIYYERDKCYLLAIKQNIKMDANYMVLSRNSSIITNWLEI